MDADPRLCLIRVVICSAIIHCDAPDHGDIFKPVPACFGRVLVFLWARPGARDAPGHLVQGALVVRAWSWVPHGPSAVPGPREHAQVRLSACTGTTRPPPAAHPCRDTPISAHGVPAAPPSTPGSATCLRLPGPHRPSAAGNPFQKQRLRWCPRHISECHNSALARQGAGRACGHSGSGGPGSGPAGLGVVMAGMGGAGVSRGSGDGGPRGLRGSGHLPEVRGVLPECLSQLSPRPLEGAAGCELLC